MWESVVVKGKKRSIVADFEDKGALSKRRLAATNARPPLHSFESLICGNKSNSFPLFFFLPESGITGTLVFFPFFFFRFWTSDWLAFHLFSLVATRFVHSSNRQTRGSRRRIFGGKVFKIIRGNRWQFALLIYPRYRAFTLRRKLKRDTIRNCGKQPREHNARFLHTFKINIDSRLNKFGEVRSWFKSTFSLSQKYFATEDVYLFFSVKEN